MAAKRTSTVVTSVPDDLVHLAAHLMPRIADAPLEKAHARVSQKRPGDGRRSRREPDRRRYAEPDPEETLLVGRIAAYGVAACLHGER